MTTTYNLKKLLETIRTISLWERTGTASPKQTPIGGQKKKNVAPFTTNK